MKLPLYQVDAFTSSPFRGNPAAVCVLDDPLDDATMASIANEMNLSETAFIRRQADAFSLRWFTPAVEVDLCGHATLATAHVLWTEGLVPEGQPIAFESRSGRLGAEMRNGFIQLDFPKDPAVQIPIPEVLRAALNAPHVRFCGKNSSDYLCLLDSEQEIVDLKPNFERLGAVTNRGVIVTSPASRQGYDFISRFFAPAVGINEDPVTGSAHCCLTPFWAERLGKSTMKAYQASRRGGILEVEMKDPRVLIRGQATTVLRGELSI